MNKDDWSSFKLVAGFNSTISNVYDAWASAEGIEKWFLRSADFFTREGRPRTRTEKIQSGDSYLWKWHGFPDDIFEKGTILEANGKDILKFTFSGGCTVSVFIRPLDEITLLDLLQENISWDDNPERNLYVQCQTGWLFYLANLKSMIEGGIDLRNKRTDLQTSFK